MHFKDGFCPGREWIIYGWCFCPFIGGLIVSNCSTVCWLIDGFFHTLIFLTDSFAFGGARSFFRGGLRPRTGFLWSIFLSMRRVSWRESIFLKLGLTWAPGLRGFFFRGMKIWGFGFRLRWLQCWIFMLDFGLDFEYFRWVIL